MTGWILCFFWLALILGAPLVSADSGFSAGGGRGVSVNYSEFGVMEPVSGESNSQTGAAVRHGFVAQLSDSQILVRPVIEVVGDPSFGEVPVVGVSSSEHNFTILNNGIADLNLTGFPKIEIVGTAANDFAITEEPTVASIPIGRSTQFRVRFNPSLPGLRLAALRVRSNDPLRDPFLLDLVGFGSVNKLLAQSIAFTAPSAVFLGQRQLPLRATSTSGLPVVFRVVSGPAAIDGNVLTLTGVGTIRVEATVAADQIYAAARSVVRAIVVRPTPTTLTLVDLVHSYDAQPHGAGVLGVANALMTYLINGVTTTTPPTAVGVYPVAATADGMTVRGTLVIAKAPLYATPTSVRRFAGQPNPQFSIAYEGFVGSDTEASVFSETGARRPRATTTAKISSPGGLYAIAAAGGRLANYAFVYRSGNLMVETFAGNYEVLLEDQANLPVGKVGFTVGRSSNALSGTVALPGEVSRLPFRAPLLVDAASETAISAVPLITRGGNSYQLNLSLKFGDGFTCNLGIDSAPAESLDGADGKLIHVIPRGERLSFAGAHTCILDPPQPASDQVPAGSGYATARVTSQGSLLISGVLGDGTKFSTGLLPDAEQGYRLHVQPYRRTMSYVAGWLYLDPHPTLAGRRFIDGADNQSLLWRKNGEPKDRTYPGGFGPVTSKISLDPWIPPTRLTAVGPLLELPDNGEFGVAVGAIDSDSFDLLPTSLQLDSKNRLIAVAPQTTTANAARWVASLNPRTGGVTGSFQLSDVVPNPTPTDPNATRMIVRRVGFGAVLRQAHGTGGSLGAGTALVPPLPQAEFLWVLSRGVRFRE